MLKIRLQRVGRVNIPTFRVVLTDSKNSAKSGNFIEVLGSYDPVNNVKEVKEDRVKYWISKGAQLSDTVHNFLVGKKIISGKKINALPKKSPVIDEEAIKKAEEEKAKAESDAKAKAEAEVEAEKAEAEAEKVVETPVVVEALSVPVEEALVVEETPTAPVAEEIPIEQTPAEETKTPQAQV